MDSCAKCHGNLSNSCRDIVAWTKVMQQLTDQQTYIAIPRAAREAKNAPDLIFHIICVTSYGFMASYYIIYLQPVADPECQPGGGDPSVDKADLTLLQVIQGEHVNGPGR